MNSRYLELDLLRTLAIAMMIIFHAAFDLQTIYGWDIDTFSGGWLLLQQATVTLFLLLVGASFAISWKRHREKHPNRSFLGLYKKYVKRGVFVVACGMLVSAVTYFAEPETYVRFGILQMIGVSILLLPFFARLREWNILLSIPLIALGPVVFEMRSGNPLLLPLGIMSPNFATVDYIPLIPWFGVVLMGYAIGYLVYVRHSPMFLKEGQVVRVLSWPGRHALIIYLIHQPILLGIFGFIGFF